jgi:hypothetical protein
VVNNAGRVAVRRRSRLDKHLLYLTRAFFALAGVVRVRHQSAGVRLQLEVGLHQSRVGRTGRVSWRDLGDAESLDKLALALRSSLERRAALDIRQSSLELGKLLWNPIEPLLGGAERILIAPALHAKTDSYHHYEGLGCRRVSVGRCQPSRASSVQSRRCENTVRPGGPTNCATSLPHLWRYMNRRHHPVRHC